MPTYTQRECKNKKLTAGKSGRKGHVQEKDV